ncbi:Cytochrome P450 [Rhynchospora pubera]|uniref:Cytochrome P450 n=1 Tax=Rhynchospora pubera TaxID=906938 RepID=A0AAV8FNT7_9POAL|nr:Cytochrome P450 [Rhynchospora pubera]
MKVQDAKFSNRPTLTATKAILYGCTDIAFSSGPYWRQLRRICVTELLSTKRVKYFSSIRQYEIHCMLKTLSTFSNDSTPVNLGAKASELTNNIVLRAAFGGNCRTQAKFLKISKEAVQSASWFCLSDIFSALSWFDVKTRRKFARIHRDLDKILEEILQEHLKKSKEKQNARDEEIEYDLVDVLIKAKERDDLEVPITLDNIKAVIMDVFTGGTDTASNIIEWAMSELIKHPDIMEKAQAEVRRVAAANTEFDKNGSMEHSYLKLVIKETLRLHPPAPILLPRLCKETCQLLGYTIPSGTIIIVNAWAIGRADDYWSDAEKFIPERFEKCSVDFKGSKFEFVPFGAGRRICPGVDFGMAVVEAALAKLLLHFDWKLPDGMQPEDLEMTETFGAVTSRKEPLSVIPVLRVPLLEA